MIISRTPLRISFGGGGSDIAAYYRQNPGGVLSTAINKYIYITVNKKFDKKIRVSYSKTEIVNQSHELQHELVKACLSLVGIENGIEITSISDIPSEGTGLGSSSSYIVGLLNALYAYQGKHVSAKQLAEDACKIEIEILKKPIGKQDQYIAAYGGLEYIKFYPDETVTVDPIICLPKTKESLQKQLLLFYTGITRSSGSILKEQSKHMGKNKTSKETMDKMVQLGKDMSDALQKNKLTTFGKLLHESWMFKKTLASSISSKDIDYWYNKALKNGAIGGKLLGAGGGGFLLFFVPIQKQKQVKKALNKIEYVPFSFEPQGSKIIFVE